MSKGHSIHAQRALESLHQAYFTNYFIRSDAARVDASCPLDQPNKHYNATMESYLGSLQVCHAADTLNSYCQSILGEILTADLSHWELIKMHFTSKNAQKQHRGLIDHGGQASEAREALRDGIGTCWGCESNVIVKWRNKFVHQGGYDPDHEVENEIHSKEGGWTPLPPAEIPSGVIPIRYSVDHWLEADIALGSWATLHVRSHIDSMDQHLCSRFNLPRNLWRSRSIKRQYGSVNPSQHAVPRSTHLSSESQQEGKRLQEMPVEIPIPRNMPKPTAKEIECAQFMRETHTSFAQMGMEYAKQINAHLVNSGGGMPGVVLPHTIRGHDLEWEMEFKSSERDEEKSEMVCFRVRESDFEPFITIWGTSSMMKDFQKDDIPEKAKQYLEECIDKTFTGSRH